MFNFCTSNRENLVPAVPPVRHLQLRSTLGVAMIGQPLRSLNRTTMRRVPTPVKSALKHGAYERRSVFYREGNLPGIWTCRMERACC
jgi:hypothetical protein